VLIRKGVEFSQKCVTRTAKERRGFRYICDKDGFQYYYNITKGESPKEVVKGYRGMIRLEKEGGISVEFPCIERANGFRHLKPGTYVIKFEPRASFPENQEIHVIRAVPPAELRSPNIFIHTANFPWQLDGCIAPGTEEWKDYGVRKSK